MENAKSKIFMIHNNVGFNDECSKCKYLYLCKTGCPFVKKLYNSNKSYTCKLQHELYKKNNKYPEDEYNDEDVYDYLSIMHPEIVDKYVSITV